MVAPFFVFQVLCLLLWSLDDFWYYSLITLVMLMLFEGMVCKQRQSSLSMLRDMRRPATNVFAFRLGRWDLISSHALIPGDIISLSTDFAQTRKPIKGGLCIFLYLLTFDLVS